MAPKKSQEEILAEMDEAAHLARKQFDEMDELDQKTLDDIAAWMNRWVSKAGWKRLGRIIAGKD